MNGSSDTLLNALPDTQTWRRILLVVNASPDKAAYELAVRLAHRDGAALILYDTGANSFWTSPFPPGEGVRPLLLAEADLRRVGRDKLADTVRDLRADGIAAMVHVSTEGHGEDLARLTANQKVDLVLCPVPLSDKFLRQMHRSRQQGAALLAWQPGEIPVFHAPLADGEDFPFEERVQVRFLAALVLTFFVAGFRNRARS